jgi:hypothetical protein
MQCKNGGWASFDKDNDRMVFQYMPFADHNAMLDPPTVDITGRILEMMATYGYDKNHPAVKRAIQFIRKRTGARRQLVRPLGRELYLRHGARSARPRSHRHGQSRALRPASRRVAAHGAKSGRRLGRKRGFLRRSQPCAAWARAHPRKPPGRFWDCSPSAIRAATPSLAASPTCCAPKRRWFLGRAISSPARVFPASSI